MAYKAFPHVTSYYRKDYREKEQLFHSKYGKFYLETRVKGRVYNNPAQHIKDATDRALAAAAAVGKGLVQPDTPIDTGLLRSRWYFKRVTWDEYRLSNDIFYANIQEKRVQMLERNTPMIQAEVKRQLQTEIIRTING
jgi:hypothetical protein